MLSLANVRTSESPSVAVIVPRRFLSLCTQSTAIEAAANPQPSSTHEPDRSESGASSRINFSMDSVALQRVRPVELRVCPSSFL